jgi:hypothetical protein
MSQQRRAERRSAVRQPWSGRAAVRLWLRPGTPPRRGDVRAVDLTDRGVGLLVVRLVEVGEEVALKLGPVLVEARVIHVAPVSDALWRIGCMFLDALPRDMLAKCLTGSSTAPRPMQ